MVEVWKPVVNFEDLYEVSNLGRVRSKRGVKRPYTNRFGYSQMTLYKNSKGYPKKVHRLVAESFLENPLQKPEVNHIDGNKLNNCVSNLEWVSSSENKIHAQKNGLCKKPPTKFGENNEASKLTEVQVNQIRSEYQKGSHKNSSISLGKKYGVSYRTILYIVNGEHWKIHQ